MTPVDLGYFEHLEQVRGKAKEAKVVENARVAVINGNASAEDMLLAVNGSTVDSTGSVVPASDVPNLSSNGVDAGQVRNIGTDKRKRDEFDSQEQEPPKERMDISLHNYGDFEQEGQL